MPKQVNHKLRRETFLQAVYETARKRGFAGVTVRAVAREAGFSPGALAHYMGSKDKLMIEAAAVGDKPVRTRMEALENLPNAVDALQQVLMLSLPIDEEKRGFWNFSFGFWDRSTHSAEVRRVTRERYSEWMGRVRRLIRHAQSKGEISSQVNVDRATRACVALMDGIAVQVLRSGHHISAKEQRAMIDDWIAFWLQPTGQNPRYRRLSNSADTPLN